jgi:hypothetical protein
MHVPEGNILHFLVLVFEDILHIYLLGLFIHFIISDDILISVELQTFLEEPANL